MPKRQIKSFVFRYWFILDSQTNHQENLKFNIKIGLATCVISRATSYPGFPRRILFYNCFPVLFSHSVRALFHLICDRIVNQNYMLTPAIGHCWVPHGTVQVTLTFTLAIVTILEFNSETLESMICLES